jgi:hypothetical protein
VLPPEEPAVATLLLVRPSPERTVTDLSAPVVCPETLPPPAVTLDDIEPVDPLSPPFLSTTLQFPGLDTELDPPADVEDDDDELDPADEVAELCAYACNAPTATPAARNGIANRHMAVAPSADEPRRGPAFSEAARHLGPT